MDSDQPPITPLWRREVPEYLVRTELDRERSERQPEALEELTLRITRPDYSEVCQIFADRLNYAWNQIERHPSRALQEVNIYMG